MPNEHACDNGLAGHAHGALAPRAHRARRVAISVASAAALAALTLSQAGAQTSGAGDRYAEMKDSQRFPDGDRSAQDRRQLVSEVMECAYLWNKDVATQFLIETDKDKITGPRVGPVQKATTKCLGRKEVYANIRFPFLSMRGWFAEFAYHDRYSGKPWIAKLDRNAVYSDFSSHGDEDDARRRLGFCTVVAAPELAVKFIESSLNSVGEYRAMMALVPAISSCVPADAQIEITIDAMRPVIADQVYRLADVAINGAQSPFAADNSSRPSSAEGN